MFECILSLTVTDDYLSIQVMGIILTFCMSMIALVLFYGRLL